MHLSVKDHFWHANSVLRENDYFTLSAMFRIEAEDGNGWRAAKLMDAMLLKLPDKDYGQLISDYRRGVEHAVDHGHEAAAKAMFRHPMMKIDTEHSKSFVDKMLVHAAQKGSAGLVECLLSQGADPTKNENRALELAIIYNNKPAARVLIEHGATPVYKDGRSMLSSVNDIETARMLLDTGEIDIKAEDSAALRMALKEKKYDLAAYLIEQGVDVGADDNEALKEVTYHPDMTAIRLLVENGADVNADKALPLLNTLHGKSPQAAAYLLEHGADPNHTEEGVMLHKAIEYWMTHTAALMIEKGANPNAKWGDHTVLNRAAQSGYAENVRVLLEGGAKPEQVDLYFAAKSHCADSVRLLHETGLDICANDNRALRLAVKNEDVTTTQYLFDQGATLEGDGWPERLYRAARNGEAQLVEMLIEHGAEVNADHDGQTPLAGACEKGHLDIAKMLLEAGANPKHGENLALRSAVGGGYTDIVELLRENGVDINREEDHLLYSATLGNSSRMMRYLLDNGVRPVADDPLNPLDTAAEKGSLENVKLLVERCDWTTADFDGAMIQAAANGCARVMDYLLEQGGDLEKLPPTKDLPWGGRDIALKWRARAETIETDPTLFADIKTVDLWETPDEQSDCLVMLAAKSGRFDKVIAAIRADKDDTLNVEDLTCHRDAKDNTVLDILGGRGELGRVFQPDLWAGRQADMESLHAELPPVYRKTIDLQPVISAMNRTALRKSLRRPGVKLKRA